MPVELTNQCVRSTRIPNLTQKSYHIVSNMVSVVCMVQRWLWRRYGEMRYLERMPAADLDKYLAEFFSVVKRTDGMEYGAHRLSCLRSNLERFLKENNYPYSIIKSLEFFNSQAAFQAKRKSVHNYV